MTPPIHSVECLHFLCKFIQSPTCQVLVFMLLLLNSYSESPLCAYKLKYIPYFLLRQVQGIRPWVEVLDAFEVDFCAERETGSSFILLFVASQLEQHHLLFFLQGVCFEVYRSVGSMSPQFCFHG